MPPLPRPQEPRGDTMSEYAKRPAPQRGAPQGLDQHGRRTRGQSLRLPPGQRWRVLVSAFLNVTLWMAVMGLALA